MSSWGAPGGDPDGIIRAGESYVIFGKATGTAVNLADIATGIGGFIINGIDVGDTSGRSVSEAGVINGDGLADLIVGAPSASGTVGVSYVVFGKTDWMAVNLSDVTAGIGGFAIFGINPGDQSGRSVSKAGDVNGDGLSDLIVGAFDANSSGNTDAGESYVILGKADGIAVTLLEITAGVGGLPSTELTRLTLQG